MNFHRDGNINKILLLSVHSNTETVHAQTYCPFMYLYIVVCWWLLISLLMPAFTQLDHSIIAISGLLDFWMPLMFFGCCCYCCCCLSVSLLFVKIWWPKIVIQQFYDHNICVPNHAEPLPRSYRCDERDVIECILYIYILYRFDVMWLKLALFFCILSAKCKHSSHWRVCNVIGVDVQYELPDTHDKPKADNRERERTKNAMHPTCSEHKNCNIFWFMCTQTVVRKRQIDNCRWSNICSFFLCVSDGVCFLRWHSGQICFYFCSAICCCCCCCSFISPTFCVLSFDTDEIRKAGVNYETFVNQWWWLRRARAFGDFFMRCEEYIGFFF